MGQREAIDAFARRQYGVFNRRQVRQAGYDRGSVRRRIVSGEWVRLGPNVFCVASAPPRWERQLAAAILSRPTAYVGGRSAAHLLGLRDFRRGRPTIVVPEGSNARLTLGRVIRSRHFDALTTVEIAGFTATSAAETLMTLARELTSKDMEAALEDALLATHVTIPELERVVTREAGAPWAGVMQRLVTEHSADAPTPDSSYLEARLERLLSRTELPEWVREFPFSIRGAVARVDVFIADWLMVVEADGRGWHGRMRDQEDDRFRDASLAARGIQVIRLTFRMITEEPAECVDMIVSAGHHRSAGRGG